MNQPQPPQGYYQGMEQPLPQADYTQEYVPQDLVEGYGSIIRDLTDSEKLIEDFKMQLLGLRKRDDGKIVRTRKTMVDADTATEITNLMKGIINQNTHFSSFDENRAINTLSALNYHLNRYLLQCGERIPLRMRANIATQAMALAQGSTFKANDGTILRWSKGGFSDTPQQRSGGGGFNPLNWILPGRKT